MAALRAGRIGWDIGSSVDIPVEEYTDLIIDLFKEGEPEYVKLLDELCSLDDGDQEDEDAWSKIRNVVAIVKH